MHLADLFFSVVFQKTYKQGEVSSLEELSDSTVSHVLLCLYVPVLPRLFVRVDPDRTNVGKICIEADFFDSNSDGNPLQDKTCLPE